MFIASGLGVTVSVCFTASEPQQEVVVVVVIIDVFHTVENQRVKKVIGRS